MSNFVTNRILSKKSQILANVELQNYRFENYRFEQMTRIELSSVSASCEMRIFYFRN